MIEHRLNVAAKLIGETLYKRVSSVALELYKRAHAFARTRGLILADTKFEFGVIDGKVTLIDECLTPDSSRFWPAAEYEEGKVQSSYDKQYVRNWLLANWDMTGDAPHLPADVIEGTSARYVEAYEMLTGTKFESMKENK